MICLVLSGPTLADCQRQLDESRTWIDLAELRADKLSREEWPNLNDWSRQAAIPLILTLRQPRDGGEWVGTTAERQAFWAAALSGAWSWADLEDDQRLPAWEAQWTLSGKGLIVSFHEFNGLGAGWLDRVRAAEAEGVVVKAAVMPRDSWEYEQFVRGVLSLSPGRRVLLAMGGFGFTSRVLAVRLGSLWTYASPRGQTVAPGQTDPQTLVELYRYRQQTLQTPVYGILGNPVFHSKSPSLHNAGLTEAGLPGVYVPFLADDPTGLLRTAELLGVRGLSCTIPHKQAVLPLVETLSDAAKAIGAVNTLVRTASGWGGHNTDAPGFLEPLRALLPELESKGAVVIGTGGAARAVVWALTGAGCRVLVLGRDLAKARALASDFGAAAAELAASSSPVVERHNDLLVQTTNVGMGEMEGHDPLSWYHFQGSEIAYEIIYVPAMTPFLARAQQAGCRLLYGRQMLNHQAWLQFRLFTGHDYPLALRS